MLLYGPIQNSIPISLNTFRGLKTANLLFRGCSAALIKKLVGCTLLLLETMLVLYYYCPVTHSYKLSFRKMNTNDDKSVYKIILMQ